MIAVRAAIRVGVERRWVRLSSASLGFAAMRDAQSSANRRMVAQTAAKTAMNVASKARHSDAGSYTKGWLDLSDLDGWAVMTLAMIFPLFRGIEHDISAIAVTAITCLTALAGTACNLGESYSEYSTGIVLFDVIQ